jgi:hypothetical protein
MKRELTQGKNSRLALGICTLGALILAPGPAIVSAETVHEGREATKLVGDHTFSQTFISTVEAEAKNSTIEIVLTGPINSESASNPNHYLVQFNGNFMQLENVTGNANGATLKLQDGALAAGGLLEVSISGVRDRNNQLIDDSHSAELPSLIAPMPKLKSSNGTSVGNRTIVTRGIFDSTLNWFRDTARKIAEWTRSSNLWEWGQRIGNWFRNWFGGEVYIYYNSSQECTVRNRKFLGFSYYSETFCKVRSNGTIEVNVYLSR